MGALGSAGFRLSLSMYCLTFCPLVVVVAGRGLNDDGRMSPPVGRLSSELSSMVMMASLLHSSSLEIWWYSDGEPSDHYSSFRALSANCFDYFGSRSQRSLRWL